ncbi:MAG: undecaprenyl/decaprenyl-phosphate alpha-N-acetylglucosaminyl 1-phosphate transferase [Deinococcota bacterium]|nr:undecaprenyl/decaprenyl-phosphate alpha-N-acetylglucosaminyl 1-phosphate transferase [Deinococcota bacterium]
MRQTLLTFLPAILLTFLVALAAVSLLAPRVRAFALRIGAVQHGGGRRVHQGALPNVGGLAIFAGFVLAVLVASAFFGERSEPYRLQLWAIMLGAALMTLVGFMDDIWELPPFMRLLSQFVAAGLLVVNGVRIDFVTNYFFEGSPYLFFGETLAVLITLLWVVGFTNAFNFIDGLDGLSSGMAAISSLSILAVAVQLPDQGATVLLLAALAGASLGFLRHNFNPAKIIMGDAGAYMIGYVLAAVSILGALKVTAAVTVAAPILILALPVLNITQVTVRRLSRGANPARAANDHIHDLIRLRSGSQRFTVLVLWLATLGLGALGMLIAQTPSALIYLTVLSSVILLATTSALRVRESGRERRSVEGPVPAATDQP